MPAELLQFTGKSIYCPAADIHIDPSIAVDRAIISHAHADHARPGSNHYLAHKDSAAILRQRLGEHISLQTVEYGEKFFINGIEFSLHPAGHIIGSAQVRVARNGEVWVFSGDYKLEDDHFSAPFESIPCNVFITESTFGLPVYHWPDQQSTFNNIMDWFQKNKEEGKVSILMGYALGKMQRILKNLPWAGEDIYAHGAVYYCNERLRDAGFDLPRIELITKETPKKVFSNALVLAPPSAQGSLWLKKFGNYSLGYCSGWMRVRGAKNRRAVDQGFVLSDHADWNDLNAAVKMSGAEKVYVTHGFTSAFARWLNENGIEAAEVKTMYGNEEETETAYEEQIANTSGEESI